MRIKNNIIMYLSIVIFFVGLLMGYQIGYRRGRTSVLKDQLTDLKKTSSDPKNHEFETLKAVLNFLDNYSMDAFEIRTKNGQRQCDESLMQNLLKLDSILSPNLRQIRKILIKDIQNHQGVLDQFIKKSYI